MKLSKKKLQELKDKKISIEELNDRYFINSQNKAEVDNIRKLLKENICSFQEIVDKFKSIQDGEDDPYLYVLLWNDGFFEELIQNNKLNKDGLKHLLNTIDNYSKLDNLLKSTILLKYIVDNELFQELVNTFKSIKRYNAPCLYRLLKNKEVFEELIKNNKLTEDDLRYLLNKIDKNYELDNLSENTTLLRYIVDKNILSFKELVNKYKNIKNYADEPCLYKLLENKELFENNILNTEDLRYLLNRIDNSDELDKLCDNTSLIKEILNDFILDKENVDRFNRVVENDEGCKNRNIHTLFDMIEYRNENNEEVLKLNKLNEQVYLLNSFDLSINEKLELIEVLRNNEQDQSLLKQLVDNNLQDQYDFDTLKKILTKDSEKKKIKMNF